MIAPGRITKHAPATLLLAGIAVVFLLRAFTAPFDDDEFQHSHFAWLIARGSVPYADFFEHHSPVYHAAVSPVFLFQPDVRRIFILRIASVLCMVGTLAAVYGIAATTAGPGGGLGAAALLAFAPFFFEKMTEVRPATPAMLLFSWSAFALFAKRKTEEPSRASMWIAGSLCGLAVLLSLKYAFVGMAMTAAAGILRGRAASIRFAAGALAATAVVCLWIALSGTLAGFMEMAVLLNLGWQHRFSPSGYAAQAFAASGALVSVGSAALLAGVSLPGARRRCAAALLLAASAILLLATVPEPYRQAFLPLLAILAVAAGELIGLVLPRIRDRPARAALAVFLFFAILPGMRQFREGLRDTNAADLDVMRTVDIVDPSGGPVFDGRGLMFYRPHVGRHACMHQGILAMLDPDEYSRGVIAALVSNRLPTVVFDYRVELMPPEIQDFIRSRYRQLDYGPIRLPGVSLDRSVLPRGATAEVPVDGEYRASWSGGGVSIDNRSIQNGQLVRLAAGSHSFKARGFTDRFELILVRRK